jgi:hypothetical protein
MVQLFEAVRSSDDPTARFSRERSATASSCAAWKAIACVPTRDGQSPLPSGESGSEAHASTQVQRRLPGELIKGSSGIKGQERLRPPAALTSGIEDVVEQGYDQRDRPATVVRGL